MIQCQMRCADGTGGKPTSGYMLSPHSVSNPKSQTGNLPKEILSQEKRKGTKS